MVRILASCIDLLFPMDDMKGTPQKASHPHQLPSTRDGVCIQARPLSYHIYTLWLFTRSDLKIVFLPQLIFAAASAWTAGFTKAYTSINLFAFSLQSSQILLWLWITLLVENISNQRLPSEILEDSLNKPWRPIPSQRVTADQARHLLLLLIPAALGISAYFGLFRETTFLFVAVWMYNDLGGANQGIIRNAFNAGGFACFNAGVAIITAGPLDYHSLNGTVLWIAVTGCIVMTTIHAQDLPDVVGDAAIGRCTIPLAYGEMTARVSLAVGMLAWSVVCSAFWDLGLGAYLPTVALGVAIAFRTVRYRDVHADKINWRLWCVWMTTVYLLPLLQRHGAAARVLEMILGLRE